MLIIINKFWNIQLNIGYPLSKRFCTRKDTYPGPFFATGKFAIFPFRPCSFSRQCLICQCSSRRAANRHARRPKNDRDNMLK